jgi:hypothetical protein
MCAEPFQGAGRCLAERPQKRYVGQVMRAPPRNLQRLILTGAASATVGTFLSLVDRSPFGAIVTVIGVLLLGAAVHLIGRAGPDAG